MRAAGRGRHTAVYISYAREDVETATRLMRELQRIGFVVRLDEDFVRTGPFAERIDAAVAGCDVFLLLISQASLRSADVRHELRLAADHARPLLPVVLEEGDNAPFRLALAGRRRVDYTARSAAQLVDVVAGVRQLAAGRRRPPPSGGRPALRAVGTAMFVTGAFVGAAGLVWVFALFAEAFGRRLGDAPPAGITAALATVLLGGVAAILGHVLGRAGRPR